LAFGAIGFADDYIKVVHRRNQGLTARAKLGLQFVASAGVAVTLVVMETRGSYSTRLMVPFAKRFRPDLVWEWLGHIPHMHWLVFLPFVIFVMIVISGASNAVNLTDGLDGLAIGFGGDAVSAVGDLAGAGIGAVGDVVGGGLDAIGDVADGAIDAVDSVIGDLFGDGGDGGGDGDRGGDGGDGGGGGDGGDGGGDF
jgi:uncharacterized membrane protein YgcG